MFSRAQTNNKQLANWKNVDHRRLGRSANGQPVSLIEHIPYIYIEEHTNTFITYNMYSFVGRALLCFYILYSCHTNTNVVCS